MTATFEFPDLKSEDVAIDVHHNRLTVSGESATSSFHGEGGYAVRERHYGKFSRMLHLPFGTKPEDVKAKIVRSSRRLPNNTNLGALPFSNGISIPTSSRWPIVYENLQPMFDISMFKW